MILLMGGTSETNVIASALAEAGYEVLVSTATDVELDVGCHARICRRAGRLTEEAMLVLVREKGIRAIVDATHPYASAAHSVAAYVADQAGVPYMMFDRPSVDRFDDDVILADSHEDAAVLAFAIGRPVLLTTGSRNLEPYIRESNRIGTLLIARVLDHPESLEACRKAGLKDEQIIVGRGPFSEADNRSTIRKHNIGALVTKDSGAAGGVEEKLSAARLESCRIVVVTRPVLVSDAFSSVEKLLDAILQSVSVTKR